VEQEARVPFPRQETAADRYICTGDLRLLARWHVHVDIARGRQSALARPGRRNSCVRAPPSIAS
jgi:hypothetical protein